jgi:hypothetical protein
MQFSKRRKPQVKNGVNKWYNRDLMTTPWYTQRTFKCYGCGFSEDRTLKDFDQEEICPKCELVLVAQPIRVPELMRTAVQHAEFNVGLGVVTKNRQHREELARQRDLVEIGSETTETIKREVSDAHAAKRAKEWDAL